MSRSLLRATGGALALSALLVLAACSGGGATPAGGPQGGQNAAAYLPETRSDLAVPEDGLPPAHLRNAPRRQPAPGPALLPDPNRDAIAAGFDGPCTDTRPAVLRPRDTTVDATGPQIRVTWEALAVEKERLANPRFQRHDQMSLAMQQKVVLVNKSHVDAQKNMWGLSSRGNQGVAVGALPDADMQTFLRGLEQRGFFQLARPTSSVQHLMQNENARGQITVERDGRSWTLVSMRGQGLDPTTKRIPPLYSETKQSVMMLRNQVSAMSVVGVQGAVLTK